METIYTSPAGRDALLAYYERLLQNLTLETTSREVSTSFGATHLLVAGPEDAPPLVLVHGANGNAVMMAGGFRSLAATRRCYFVDVPGEPNRSSERRPGKAGPALGRWMGEVLDALALPRVAMLGVSGGAYVTLKCCEVIPARLSRVALIVPEGLSRSGFWRQLVSVLAPMIRYRVSPSTANVRRFLAALSTAGAPISEDSVEHMSLALKHVRAVMDLGELFSARQLAGLRAPVLLLAAGRDVLFPGAAAIRRAREVLPTLADAVLVPEANHIDIEFFRGPLLERVRAFLSSEPADVARDATSETPRAREPAL